MESDEEPDWIAIAQECQYLEDEEAAAAAAAAAPTLTLAQGIHLVALIMRSYLSLQIFILLISLHKIAIF
jgi:hypothetical protein